MNVIMLSLLILLARQYLLYSLVAHVLCLFVSFLHVCCCRCLRSVCVDGDVFTSQRECETLFMCYFLSFILAISFGVAAVLTREIIITFAS